MITLENFLFRYKHLELKDNEKIRDFKKQKSLREYE